MIMSKLYKKEDRGCAESICLVIMKTKIIIVDSVKGGCGKTTISLKNVIRAFEESEKEREEKHCKKNDTDDTKKNPIKVCLVDFDLLGSSMETFLTGKPTIDSKTEKEREDEVPISDILDPGITSGNNTQGLRFKFQKKSVLYLNDYFNGSAPNYLEFLNHVLIVNESLEEQYRFDLLMSNPHQEQKNMFKVKAENQYIEQLDYNYFRTKIIKLIEMLNFAEYTHIIFDMPPNSDSYTDILFDILYQHQSPFSKECSIETELLVVSSLDVAHFNANLEWLKVQSENCNWKRVFLYEREFRLVMNNLVDYERFHGKTAKLINLLGTRLQAYDDAMKFQHILKEIYYYDYDENTALSATTDRGIVFSKWKMKKMSRLRIEGKNNEDD